MTDSETEQEVGGWKNCTGQISLYPCHAHIFCHGHCVGY